MFGLFEKPRKDTDGAVLIGDEAELERAIKKVMSTEEDMIVRFEKPVPNGPKDNFLPGPYKIEFDNLVVWDRKGLRTKADVSFHWLGSHEEWERNH